MTTYLKLSILPYYTPISIIQNEYPILYLPLNFSKPYPHSCYFMPLSHPSLRKLKSQEKILLYLPHQIYHLTCICNHTIIVSSSTVKSINITRSHGKPTFPHLLPIPSTSALNTPLAFSIYFLLQLSLWFFMSSVSFSHLYWLDAF